MRDRDIRCELKRSLKAEHGDDPGTIVVEELGLLQGEARVDIAVVNGQLHGYEIKSAHDTLTRLPGQALAYSQVFDRVTLVLTGRHADRASAIAPSWWEFCLACEEQGAIVLTCTRPGGPNPALNARALAELLWRDEVVELLEDRGAARGMRSKPRWTLWNRLCEIYTVDEVATAVRERLKRRLRSPPARS